MNEDLFMKILATVVFGGVLLSVLVGVICVLVGTNPLPAIAVLIGVVIVEFSMILFGVWKLS